MHPRRRPSVSLLGGFELRRGDGAVPVPMSVERVVAFVALHVRPVNRSFVAGTLWPETTDHRAAANLRSALWRLRRLSPGLLRTSPEYLELVARAEVDTTDVLSSIWRILDSSDEPRSSDVLLVSEAAELLPGWYDEWVVVERERLRQLRLHALEAVCERFTERRQFSLAIEAGLAAVNQEPLRESGHRALIRARLAEGNVSEAIRQYRRFRTVLGDELGLEPSSEMLDLVRPVADPTARAPAAMQPRREVSGRVTSS